MILAVPDLKVFHKENLHKNRSHYTIMNRVTHTRVINLLKNRGGKVHFNHMKIEDPELSAQTGSNEKIVNTIIVINLLVAQVRCDIRRRLGP